MGFWYQQLMYIKVCHSGAYIDDHFEVLHQLTLSADYRVDGLHSE